MYYNWIICLLCSYDYYYYYLKFEADRSITFVPPDGEFELMRYRITDNVNLPFRVLPVIEEHGANHVEMNIQVRLCLPACASPALFSPASLSHTHNNNSPPSSTTHTTLTGACKLLRQTLCVKSCFPHTGSAEHGVVQAKSDDWASEVDTRDK